MGNIFESGSIENGLSLLQSPPITCNTLQISGGISASGQSGWNVLQGTLFVFSKLSGSEKVRVALSSGQADHKTTSTTIVCSNAYICVCVRVC